MSPDLDRLPTITGREVIDWLLDGDPAIRWQVLRDLMDAPLEVVVDERAGVASSGWGARLLELQSADGTWGGGLYSPKWTSTTYTLLLLRRFGLDPAHDRARLGVETIWNCRNVRFGDRHSSFHTSILALEALAEVQRAHPDRVDLSAAMGRGREFFLRHRLYRSHRTGACANPAFTRLSFPPRWHYDLLRGLEHFAVTDSPHDDRYADALGVLDQRRRADGTWPAQNRHQGRVWFEMERTGKPSRWNTLRALRVTRWSMGGDLDADQ